MARKPSDNIRDAARKLKVEAQRNPRVLAPGTTGAFSDKTAHPKQTNNSSDLKIDHKESHHLMPVDAYTAFTEGMTPGQMATVDATMESHDFYKGDNNLNRTDLWKRYHTGRSKGVYKGKGAHQVANQAGVDGPKAKAKWAGMSPDERFNNLDMFVDDMTKNRTIGYQANMEARWLLGNDNTPDNIYGGNFSQRILNPRNAENAASTAKKTQAQREFLNQQGGSTSLNINAIMTKANMPALGGFTHHSRTPSVTADQSTYTPPKLQPSQSYTLPDTPITPKVNRSPSVLENAGAVLNQAMPVITGGALLLGGGLQNIGGALRFMTGGGF